MKILKLTRPAYITDKYYFDRFENVGIAWYNSMATTQYKFPTYSEIHNPIGVVLKVYHEGPCPDPSVLYKAHIAGVTAYLYDVVRYAKVVPCPLFLVYILEIRVLDFVLLDEIGKTWIIQ